MLIAAEKIGKQYREKPVLEGCSCYIESHTKAGIIGRNGSGKSTLLKLLSGVEQPDAGEITRHGSVRVGYLGQASQLDPEQTVLQQVLGGSSAQVPQEYEAKQALYRLGVTALDVPVGQMSGGEKKRVALAKVLVTPCDVLLLDEPTNHLDNEMIVWLERFLISYSGALLMVTHDRYFLERVVSQIWEVQGGSLYTYDANFSQYLERKAQREEQAQSTERKRQALLRKELEWIRRGPQGRGTKSKARIDRYEALRDQEGPGREGRLELGSVASRLGKKIIELEGISKQYEDRVLIRGFHHMVARDARIGIVGSNGCGKSTLLRIIAGLEAADGGEVIRGDTVKIGYFSQEPRQMEPDMRVIDYVREIGNFVETTRGQMSASQLLETFLFPPEVQWTPVGRLSGGERRRLQLLGVLAGAPNVLLLDEPTNDLDIETLLLLEDYLEAFPGAVLVVSHDRYFLDKTTNRILAFQEEGEIRESLGGYSDYLQQQAREQETEQKRKEPEPREKKPRRNENHQKLRLGFKEQREYDTIQGDIEALEQAQQETEKEIAEAASDYERLEPLLLRQTQLEHELDEKLERWLYLQELVEKIGGQQSI